MVVIARTVRVEGAGEGVIAEPLETLAKANPDLSLGSYPFYGPQGYGSNLVVRGRDGAAVERDVDAADRGAGRHRREVDQPRRGLTALRVRPNTAARSDTRPR